MDENAGPRSEKEEIESREEEVESREKIESKGDEKESRKEEVESRGQVESKGEEKEMAEELNISGEDEELLQFLNETKPKICVVGAGGSGCNTINRLHQMGVHGAELVAVNTDVQHLLKTKANKKVLIGKKLTKGMGAGSNPEIGEAAAKESTNDIEKALDGASMVFVTCGLGGGTGTGSAHIIAEVAKNLGALTIGIVTLPFYSEGRGRRKNALEGLNRLKKKADTTIVIPNDKLLTLAPDLPLNTAFRLSDEVLAGASKGITELITKAGLVNLDFADIRTTLANGGYAVIGAGESTVDAKPDERARSAIETALNSPLLDAEIGESDRALVNVVGGADMTLREAELMVTEVSSRIAKDSHIIWGARVDEELPRNIIKVLVLIAGAEFPEYKIEMDKIDKLEIDLDSI